MSIRVDDLYKTKEALTGAVNALTNARDVHNRDNYNQKMAALEQLKFDTLIGGYNNGKVREENERNLRRLNDDSIFGGIKQMFGMYDSKGSRVSNSGRRVANEGSGGGIADQIGAISGMRDNQLEWMDTLGKKERTRMDKAGYNRLIEDMTYNNVRGGSDFKPIEKLKKADSNEFKAGLNSRRRIPEEMLDDNLNLVTKNEQLGSLNSSNIENVNKTSTVDKSAGLDRAFSANNQPVVREEVKQEKALGRRPAIKVGDTNSYYQSANYEGVYRDEFEGSFEDMHGQNLNMYSYLIDEAVARKDWKTAEKLNREYRANVQAIDKKWQYERGKGEFIDLYGGQPVKEKKQKPTERAFVVIDKNGKEVVIRPYLTDEEARDPWGVGRRALEKFMSFDNVESITPQRGTDVNRGDQEWYAYQKKEKALLAIKDGDGEYMYAQGDHGVYDVKTKKYVLLNPVANSASDKYTKDTVSTAGTGMYGE